MVTGSLGNRGQFLSFFVGCYIAEVLHCKCEKGWNDYNFLRFKDIFIELRLMLWLGLHLIECKPKHNIVLHCLCLIDIQLTVKDKVTIISPEL